MIFLVVLFTQPPLSESTKRVPINSIDGTLNQFIMYQSEIFAPSPPHPTPPPIHMNYIVYEQFNNLVHSPLKSIYYVAI